MANDRMCLPSGREGEALSRPQWRRGGTTWQDGRESALAGRGWQESGNEGSGGPGDVDAQLLRI